MPVAWMEQNAPDQTAGPTETTVAMEAYAAFRTQIRADTRFDDSILDPGPWEELNPYAQSGWIAAVRAIRN